MERRAMSIDIAEWLRNLGLGQYEASFRDNEIDEAERYTWLELARRQ
jgi:hypothetical protein